MKKDLNHAISQIKSKIKSYDELIEKKVK